MYRLRNNNRKALNLGKYSNWNNKAVLEKMASKGISFPSWEELFSVREGATDVLLSNGYKPSPCCFWSAPNTYPNGNIPVAYKNKWENYDSHIAFGPGVYSWLSGLTSDQPTLQIHNTMEIHKYSELIANNQHAIGLGRALLGETKVWAALGFSFKSMQPFTYKTYMAKYGVDLRKDAPFRDTIETLVNEGFIEEVGSADTAGLCATLRGEELHEEIAKHYFYQDG